MRNVARQANKMDFEPDYMIVVPFVHSPLKRQRSDGGQWPRLYSSPLKRSGAVHDSSSAFVNTLWPLTLNFTSTLKRCFKNRSIFTSFRVARTFWLCLAKWLILAKGIKRRQSKIIGPKGPT